ncbi:MAG: sigma-70 family RNA polymerase sigma factor [Planctomycetota bacterium]
MDRRSQQVESMPAAREPRRVLSQLLADQWPRLKRFIAYQCGPLMRQKESVSDLAQSACREALEHWSQFRGDHEALRQWLFEIAKHKIITRRRYWGRHKRAQDREVSAVDASDSPAFVATPSDAAVAEEQAQELADALARLSEADRTIIMLARYEGWSHAEIAGHLHLSEPTARQQLSRALARLEHLLRRSP